MKKVTSITVWDDAVGKRLSVTYSEIDDETGKIVRDNVRVDRVLTDATAISGAQAVLSYAQTYIDSL